MKILSITAQKPSSTGSGVFLTELVRVFARQGHTQRVIAGVYKDDAVVLPEDLPAFEERLTQAIRDSIQNGPSAQADVSRISWERIAQLVTDR